MSRFCLACNRSNHSAPIGWRLNIWGGDQSFCIDNFDFVGIVYSYIKDEKITYRTTFGTKAHELQRRQGCCLALVLIQTANYCFFHGLSAEMTTAEVAANCGTDVLVSFAEFLRVSTGLLTVAAVCGGLTGIFAASLLYLFCMKPLLLTRQVSTSLNTSFSQLIFIIS